MNSEGLSLVVELLERDAVGVVLTCQVRLDPAMGDWARQILDASSHRLSLAGAGDYVAVDELDWTERHCFSEHPIALIGIRVSDPTLLALDLSGPVRAMLVSA